MITAVLDLGRADREYTLDNVKDPPFLCGYWEKIIREVKQRANTKPE